MASEWPITTVRALVDAGILERPIDGNHGEQHPKQTDFVADGIPFIMASDLVNGRVDTINCAFIREEQARILRKGFAHTGDVLISHKATMGRTAMVGPLKTPFLVLTPQVTYYRVIDYSRLNNRFLKLYFDCPTFQTLFETWGHKGSTRLYLGITSQLDLPIIVPPIEEQKAIACILCALDDKIELNRGMNETLESIARAVFKSWFIDFDPVRAKAAVRREHPDWSNERVSRTACPNLKPEIAAMFPDTFEDSKLREIPKGSRIGKLGNVVGFLPGYAFSSKDWTDQGVPVVKIGSVKPGIVDLGKVSFVSEAVSQKASKFRLSPGDLLIGMTGYVGEVGLVPPTDNPPLLNQRVGKFLFEVNGTAALGFTYCFTRQPEFKAAVETKSHGTAQANVSTEGILSIELLVPPKPLRDKLNALCQPILDKVLNNYAELSTLAALRDTLLPKLISGELRVADVERIVERCT